MRGKNKINSEAHILWPKIKQGDLKALGNLYDLYIDSLISFGIKICGDKSYTMDCVHDLFLDLYKYKSKLGEPESIQFYLCLALKRKINKKYKVKEVCLNDNDFNSALNSTMNYEKSFEDELVEKEHYKEKVIKLNSSISQLTEKQQEGLKLRFVEERSYDDIALVLNISVSSARTSVYRALKTLRKGSILLIISFISYFF
ncbi:RNA polymerase sigma factor [Lutibacter citreus]|uniref:RNA polymerase sigma factor n=1 Tax=Lutibacter citreus TaxID=2138210 RepID=UPI000DBE346E|nr:sigma-70 family RNA polymerase sigma factor [Lutibacter citreus]